VLDHQVLSAVLEQYRDAEILQSIHRARPLRNKVDVWLLTNVPIAGLPVQLTSLHALYGALPFAGDTTTDLINNVLAGRVADAPPKARVPRWMRQVLLRGLA